MNKAARFLIVFIVLLATILTSSWKINSQACPDGGCQAGRLVGKTGSPYRSRHVTPAAVLEKNIVQRGLSFVEFFAGY